MDSAEYINRIHRTIAKPESHSLVGSSMGDRGVLDKALRFSEIYGVVCAMFAGQMGFHRFGLAVNAED